MLRYAYGLRLCEPVSSGGFGRTREFSLDSRLLRLSLHRMLKRREVPTLAKLARQKGDDAKTGSPDTSPSKTTNWA